MPLTPHVLTAHAAQCASRPVPSGSRRFDSSNPVILKGLNSFRRGAGVLYAGWLIALFSELYAAAPAKAGIPPPIDLNAGAEMEVVDSSRAFVWQKGQIFRTDDG